MESQEQQHLEDSIKFGFGYAVMISPWICSPGAREDAGVAADFANSKRMWYDGKPITESDLLNTAALNVLVDMGLSLERRQSFNLVRRIGSEVCDSLYDEVEASITTSRMNFGRPINKRTAHLAYMFSVIDMPHSDKYKMVYEKDTKLNASLITARGIYQARGKIVEQQFSVFDMMDALAHFDANRDTSAPDEIAVEDGKIIEIHNLPDVPDIPTEIPFYNQYIDSRKAAKTLLHAFIEDFTELDHQLRA